MIDVGGWVGNHLVVGPLHETGKSLGFLFAIMRPPRKEGFVSRDGAKQVFQAAAFGEVRETLHVEEHVVFRSRRQHADFWVLEKLPRVLARNLEVVLQTGLVAQFLEGCRDKTFGAIRL